MLKFLPLALMALIVTSCTSIKEKEPNDHYTKATLIKNGAKVKGTLSTSSDIDVYRIEINKEGGHLFLHVGGIKEVDFILSFQDQNRQELKRYDETGVGGDEKAFDLGTDPGTYFIALSNKNAKANNPKQEYEMDVQINYDLNNEREPNDTGIKANQIEIGSLFRGHYFPTYNPLADGETEEDWFRLDISSGKHLLNLDLSEVPKVDPVLAIYDSNFYKLQEIDSGGIGKGEMIKGFGITGPIHYFVSLRSKKKFIGNSEIPYEILTEILPYRGQMEFEPNDQRLEATPFVHESIQGNIHPKGDADWYKVSVEDDSKRIMTARLEGLPEMDLKLTLHDVLGQPLIKVNNHRKGKPEYLTGVGVTGGEYYLVVSEWTRKKANSQQSYTLTQKMIPYQEGLEFEVNDSSSTSQAIEVGQILNGYLAPKGDTDWYEFNVYSEGTGIIELTGLVNVQWTLSLYDQEYNVIATKTAKEPGQSLKLEKKMETGTYAIRIRAGKENQNNVRDKYTLRIKVQ